jgi:hypothetical protein
MWTPSCLQLLQTILQSGRRPLLLTQPWRGCGMAVGRKPLISVVVWRQVLWWDAPQGVLCCVQLYMAVGLRFYRHCPALMPLPQGVCRVLYVWCV